MGRPEVQEVSTGPVILRAIKRREGSYVPSVRRKVEGFGCAMIRLKPTVKGFPDYMIIGPAKGTVAFLEMKRTGEEPDVAQVLVHTALRKRGHHVFVVRGAEYEPAFDEWLRKMRK